MKKPTTLLMLFACSLGQAEEIDLYVMAGQSNMFGVVPMPDLPADLMAPQDIPFKFSMQYVPSRNFYSAGFIDLQPISNFSPVYGGPPYFLSTFASELSFGQTLQQRSSAKIAILKVCANGTSLAVDWNPGTPTSLYHRLVITTGEAIAELTARGYQPSVKGLVWVQGETDAQNSVHAQNYGTNLGNFFDELRTEAWFPPEVPFVFNQLHSATAASSLDKTRVRNAQALVAAARTDNVYMLNNDDLGLHTDSVHYTGAMQIEVGNRFADLFLPAVPEPSTVHAALTGLCVVSLYLRRKSH